MRSKMPGVQEPTAGEKQRAKIIYELSRRGVKQGAVSIEAKTSAAMVSRVLAGERCDGEATKRVQRVVADILKQPIAEIFTVTKEPVQG